MKFTRIIFAGILAAFAVSAASALLIPFALDSEGNLNGAGYAAGVMFWAGLIIGCAGYTGIRIREDQKIREKLCKRKLPSALCFFSNIPAAVMDCLLIAGIIGTICCTVNESANQMAAAVFLLFALAGLYAHFLLNGKLYQHIWNNKLNKKRTA